MSIKVHPTTCFSMYLKKYNLEQIIGVRNANFMIDKLIPEIILKLADTKDVKIVDLSKFYIIL